MAKPQLLYLTNLYTDSEEEDIYLSNYLRKYFNVYITHPLDASDLEDRFDLVLIRNIWPTHEYENRKTELIRRLIKKGFIPRSSVENGYLKHKNYLEKEYLLDLFKQGYPVIPSVDRISDLDKLGSFPHYFIKPKNKCDGIGSAKVTRRELLKKGLRNYIIQPYIEFDYEICFYFIDNKFVQAFSTPNRLRQQGYKIYKPTSEDLNFARKFVKWNNLLFGLQRVDAIRVKSTKKLLLTELEDLAPYLYLLELPTRYRAKMAYSLLQSLNKILFR